MATFRLDVTDKLSGLTEGDASHDTHYASVQEYDSIAKFANQTDDNDNVHRAAARGRGRVHP